MSLIDDVCFDCGHGFGNHEHEPRFKSCMVPLCGCRGFLEPIPLYIERQTLPDGYYVTAEYDGRPFKEERIVLATPKKKE